MSDCGNGFLCPSGLVCAPGRDLCVSPQQIASCSGISDGTACTFGNQNGLCDGGACIIKCGNGMIDPGEMCDGAPPAGKSCLDFGFDAGRLACSDTCGPGLADCRHVGWISMQSPTPKQLSVVWGSGPSDVYASGPGAGLIHYNGTAWANADPAPDAQTFVSLWGSGPDDVWAMSDDGTPSRLFRFDGKSWSVLGSYNPGPIWGSGSGDVYFSDGEHIYHFQDGVISVAYTELMAGMRGIWGSGPNDVFVVGDSGVVHFDGKTWQPAVDLRAQSLSSVWGSGPDDVYAVGAGGLFHYHVSSWSTVVLNNALTFGDHSGAIWGGGGGNDTFVLSDLAPLGVLHFDGQWWSIVTPDQKAPFRPPLRSLWGASPHDLFGVGDDGAIMHYQGSIRRLLKGPGNGVVWSIWGTDIENTYAVISGTAWHYDGNVFTAFSLPSDADSREVTTLWGVDRQHVFAAGTGFVAKFDGNGWSLLPPGPTAATGLWGTGPDDLFAVGGDGLFHFDGNGWSPVECAGLGAFQVPSLSGSGSTDLYIFGGGAPLHWNGLACSPLSTPQGVSISAVWASGPTDVYLAGDDALLHYDGASGFTNIPVHGASLSALWGTGPSDVFAAGAQQALLHYDGTSWEPVNYDFQANITAVGGIPGEVWFGEEGGAISVFIRTALPGP